MKNSTFYDILLWKDARKSAAAFILSLFLLTAFSFYSVLTVLTCIAIPFLSVMLTLRAIWVLKCVFMKESLDNPFQSWLAKDIELNEDKITNYNKSLLLFVNKYAIYFRKICLVADLMITAKALGILFLMYYLGNAFSGITLLFAADIIAFTIPKVFQMYQKEIESFKKKLTDKYNDFHSKVQAAMPFGGKEKQKSS